jgi:hypothetical protein
LTEQQWTRPKNNQLVDGILYIGEDEFTNLCAAFIKGYKFWKKEDPKKIVFPSVTLVLDIPIEYQRTVTVEEHDKVKESLSQAEARVEELEDQLSKRKKPNA